MKDPDHSNTPSLKREQFAAVLRSGKIIQQLAGKFRDSRWFNLMRGALDMTIVYVVLLAMERAEPAPLPAKRNELRANLPVKHALWPAPCVDDCIILNLRQFQARFGKESVWRDPAASPQPTNAPENLPNSAAITSTA